MMWEQEQPGNKIQLPAKKRNPACTIRQLGQRRRADLQVQKVMKSLFKTCSHGIGESDGLFLQKENENNPGRVNPLDPRNLHRPSATKGGVGEQGHTWGH